MTTCRRSSAAGSGRVGKLRIGNQWNAIRIIALWQSDPLKAIAKFVENPIDAARAENIMIVHGKSLGKQYLKVSDDGEDGRPRRLRMVKDSRSQKIEDSSELRDRIARNGSRVITRLTEINAVRRTVAAPAFITPETDTTSSSWQA